MKTIKFTKDEADLILDRLAVADAMIEAMTDYDPEHDEPPPFAAHNLDDSITRLTDALERPPHEAVLCHEADEAVLVEAIEGATIMYRSADAYREEGSITRKEWAKILRDSQSIERKLKAAGIKSSGFPPT